MADKRLDGYLGAVLGGLVAVAAVAFLLSGGEWGGEKKVEGDKDLCCQAGSVLSGRVEFEVRGLVLAGGNAIGTVNEARRQQPGLASIDCVGFTKGV
jgi:hypothetical protein